MSSLLKQAAVFFNQIFKSFHKGQKKYGCRTTHIPHENKSANTTHRVKNNLHNSKTNKIELTIQ